MTDKIAASIIIPCYNEEEGIRGVLEELLQMIRAQQLPYEVIVVNDGSSDRTGKILAGIEGITVIEHQYNRGYGASLKTGLRNATHDIIVITDADGTYPNERIPELVSYMHDYDMVVGARIGSDVHIPSLRRFPKWVLGKLANYLANTQIDDINSGLRVFKKNIAQHFISILPDGFSFTMTITLAMHTNAYNVRYVPIAYHARIGNSKIRPIRDTLRFTNIIVRTVMYFNPFRVFAPIGCAFLLASIIIAIVSLLMGDLYDLTTLILFVAGTQILMLGALAEVIDKRSRINEIDD